MIHGAIQRGPRGGAYVVGSGGSKRYVPDMRMWAGHRAAPRPMVDPHNEDDVASFYKLASGTTDVTRMLKLAYQAPKHSMLRADATILAKKLPELRRAIADQLEAHIQAEVDLKAPERLGWGSLAPSQEMHDAAVRAATASGLTPQQRSLSYKAYVIPSLHAAADALALHEPRLPEASDWSRRGMGRPEAQGRMAYERLVGAVIDEEADRIAAKYAEVHADLIAKRWAAETDYKQHVKDYLDEHTDSFSAWANPSFEDIYGQTWGRESNFAFGGLPPTKPADAESDESAWVDDHRIMGSVREVDNRTYAKIRDIVAKAIREEQDRRDMAK